MKNPVVTGVVGFFVAFAVSAGAAYGVTNYLYAPASGNSGPVAPVATPAAGGSLNIDPSAPKIAECPLNGEMYTAAEQKVWQQRRPLNVMIENTTDARPQSGLNSADIVYEAVAEGGITRFEAVFLCGTASHDTIVGPVRSARTYFLDIGSEYNSPLYTHVGGANCSAPAGTNNCTTDKRAQALEQINQYGWGQENDLNQFSIGFPTFWRDYERLGRTVATEHTMYSSTEKLWQYAASSRNWTNINPVTKKDWLPGFTSWTFKDDAKSPGTVNKISFGFWTNYHDFDVVWSYDPSSNTYSRTDGGAPQMDRDNNTQLSAKVVVVQYAKETGPVDSHMHMLYQMIGTGKAVVFQDGTATKATWTKTDRTARTIFTDAASGKKIAFDRGRIWVEVIPSDNTVTY